MGLCHQNDALPSLNGASHTLYLAMRTIYHYKTNQGILSSRTLKNEGDIRWGLNLMDGIPSVMSTDLGAFVL